MSLLRFKLKYSGFLASEEKVLDGKREIFNYFPFFCARTPAPVDLFWVRENLINVLSNLTDQLRLKIRVINGCKKRICLRGF